MNTWRMALAYRCIWSGMVLSCIRQHLRCAWLGALLLGGCATPGRLPAPRALPPLQSAHQFQAVTCGKRDAGRQSLLIVQPLEAQRWRWLQFDAFGAPQARQILADGQWHNDGFLPPNPGASRLFAALSTRLMAPAQRAALFPDMQIQQVEDTEIFFQDRQWRWQIREQPPPASGWQVTLPDGDTWCIRPLDA